MVLASIYIYGTISLSFLLFDLFEYKAQAILKEEGGKERRRIKFMIDHFKVIFSVLDQNRKLLGGGGGWLHLILNHKKHKETSL